jgi:hypothetical protein
MSECQYVAFRAIDGPVSEKNLNFMRRQSSKDRKKAEAAARQRAKKLADMATDPTRAIRTAEQLVKERPPTPTVRLPGCWPISAKPLPAVSSQTYLNSRHAS